MIPSEAPLTGRQQRMLRESQVFLAVSVIVGVLAGLAAVLFALAIDRVAHLFFGVSPSTARLALTPPLVSIATGVLLVKVFPDVRGSGVPQTEAAFHLQRGVIGWRVPIGKFITGVLCIGSGHSMGREGPSVQIGAGLASGIGRLVGLSPERVRELVPVGAAGALAAAFNTPVAAVLFSLEEIIGDMNASLIGSTVVASVASVIVERSILGNEPLFHVPTYHLEHPAELAAYALLGVCGGLISVVFCKVLLALRAGFGMLPARTRIWQPAMGGVVIGLMLVAAPQVMGVGYEYVNQALNSQLVLGTMAMLCAMKLAATIVSYASGNAGGIFAPTLYIGAMAGGAVGMFVRRFAPFPTADPGAYALVGMGVLFAGIIRAPMTSVFMIFEITQDYQILVPLMVANLLSFVISRHYQHEPVYHALLHQDGIHIPAITSREAGAMPIAADLMSRASPFAPPSLSVVDAAAQLEASDAPGVAVGEDGHLVGVVSRRRIADAVRDGDGNAPLQSLVSGSRVHTHPDHPLDVVMARLAEGNGIVPVVSRENVNQVVGIITPDLVLRSLQSARK